MERPIFPNLRSLDLARCLNITDDGLREIVKNFQHLERLDITSCEEITDKVISEIASKCKN